MATLTSVLHQLMNTGRIPSPVHRAQISPSDLLLGHQNTKGFDLAAHACAQGSRMRNTKTEYVSCPSCGRTLFDLQEVTEQIRTQTGHLPGVSIAVMGCIVNGPGEMADADFGCAPRLASLRGSL